MTFRCSDEAAARHDPMLGTAPPQRDWLLVEHPGPWPVSAPFGADLPTSLLGRLGHPELRTLFIRRFGRAGSADRLTGPRTWFRCREGSLRTGTWEHPEDLLRSLEVDGGESHSGPLMLVCTHGVHDLCCAVRGRPVAQALSQRWPSETYECSHLGGDRFAPNILLFPDLACYAGMQPDDAVSTVEAHLSGRVDTRHLRGLAGLHPAEQVALGAVLQRWGPAPATALRTALADQDGTFDAGTWTVQVRGQEPLPSHAHVVVTSRRLAEPARLTCRATRETRPVRWDVASIDHDQPPESSG